MKQRKRGRLAGIILTVVMMLTMFPLVVSAANEGTESVAASKEVYLNGQAGDDGNGGTGTTDAVKTLSKAIDLAGADGTILVCGTVPLQNAGTVDLTNASIQREDTFTGVLIEVADGTTLNISNTTIDGNKAVVKKAKGVLIDVQKNGILNINNGTKLSNNVYAAVCVAAEDSNGTEVATVNMTGGEICDNESAGSYKPRSNGNVWIDEYGVFNMSGGAIYNGYSEYEGAGVIINHNTGKFYMNAGSIYDNECPDGYGGGIANYGYAELNGGTISGNSASGGGGVATMGIGETVLNATEISDNTATFEGGGGVYVVGSNSETVPANECKFTMTGGSIVNNKSEDEDGGGIYGFYGQTGYPTIIEISGGTISGNTTTESGNAISLRGTPDYAKLRLSGTPTIDGTVFLNDARFAMIKVEVVGAFNPGKPVTLEDTKWTVGNTIVTYVQGVWPNTKHFATTDPTYGYLISGQDLKRAKLATVTFREKGSSGNDGIYGTIQCATGAVIPMDSIPEINKVGYAVSGWERDPDYAEWDIAKDKVTGNMTLYPVWSLNAPTVALAAENNITTVHEGGSIKLIATPSHELGEAITAYQYEWYKDGVKIEGQTTEKLTVTESGNYTVKVQATDGKLTSAAVESTAVVCTVTPHIKSTAWTTDGENHWKTCTVEGCTAEFDKAAHTGGAATCTSGPICTTCDTEYGTELGHSYTNYVPDGNATCTADGTKTATCDCGCGTEDTIPDPESALGHDMGEWVEVTSPSCTDKGSKERTCKRTGCGYKETDDVDPNGHEWETEYTTDTAATCTQEGWESIHCKNCSVTKDGRAIPAAGHTYTAGEYASDEEGHWQVCNVCKAETAHTAHGFEWIVDKEATCTEAGSKHEACTVCQYAKEAVEIPMIDHVYANEWKSDENGHWLACTACGDKDKEAEHTFEWIIDKEATADEKGSKHEECTVCHYKKDAVEIPATGKPEEPGEGTDKPSEPSDKPGTGEDTDKPSDPSDKPGTGGDTDKPSDPADKPGSGEDTNKPSEPSGKPSKPEQPSKPSQSTGSQAQTSNNAPKTGDNSNVIIWASLLAVSAVGVGVVLVVGKKRNSHRK